MFSILCPGIGTASVFVSPHSQIEIFPIFRIGSGFRNGFDISMNIPANIRITQSNIEVEHAVPVTFRDAVRIDATVALDIAFVIQPLALG